MLFPFIAYLLLTLRPNLHHDREPEGSEASRIPSLVRRRLKRRGLNLRTLLLLLAVASCMATMFFFFFKSTKLS